MENLGKSNYRHALGAWGENEATHFLMESGLKIIDRNFRTREGEIDIVAEDGKTLVFVEVKTRSSLSKGFPEEAVTSTKMAHLFIAAEKYMQINPQYDDWRIDVIAISGKKGSAKIDIKWFKDANA
jgi:putative endonuclease